MHIHKYLVTATLIAGFLAFPGATALASPSENFGVHVSDCAQTMGFSGDHNPGMHRGAAGWDGTQCR